MHSSQEMKLMILKLRTVTPLYMSGANTRRSEIRAQSIKGLLRYWFRALSPEYETRESEIFGSSESGKSLFSVRIKSGELGRAYIGIPPDKTYRHKIHVDRNSGLGYLAFLFSMKGGEREAIDVGQTFSVLHTINPTKDYDLVAKAIVTGWWGILNFGGMGTRSRRGFGSVAIAGMDRNSQAIFERVGLFPKYKDPRDWKAKIKRGLETIQNWYNGRFESSRHTTIGRGTQIRLYGDENGEGFKSWENALNAIGEAFRDFRRPIKPTVRKGVFGLPITGRGISVNPTDDTLERRASPIIFNVITISKKYYVVVTLTTSEVLPKGVRMTDGTTNVDPDTGLLREFMDSIDSQTVERVVL